MSEAKGNLHQQDRKPILSGHKRVGKRLIPPMMQLPKMSEVSWVKIILPELLWLGLLNDQYGYAHGAEISLTLSKAAIEARKGNESTECFITISSYSQLAVDQKNQIIDLLKANGYLDKYQVPLRVLDLYYPECPLNFIFGTKHNQPNQAKDDLESFKKLLMLIFSRTSVEATFVQASAIYIAFITDKLKVVEGSVLAEFPKIQDYPKTEISKKIASMVRATINLLIGNEILHTSSTWPTYFWNRGYQLEPCEFELGIDDE